MLSNIFSSLNFISYICTYPNKSSILLEGSLSFAWTETIRFRIDDVQAICYRKSCLFSNERKDFLNDLLKIHCYFSEPTPQDLQKDFLQLDLLKELHCYFLGRRRKTYNKAQ